MQDPRIEEARRAAFVLYREGVRTPHRSCGIALAETFGLATATYQAFRRGGFSGAGPCGAIQAGLFIPGCTNLVAEVAALVAGVALRHGVDITVAGSPVDAAQAGQMRS